MLNHTDVYSVWLYWEKEQKRKDMKKNIGKCKKRELLETRCVDYVVLKKWNSRTKALEKWQRYETEQWNVQKERNVKRKWKMEINP